MRLPRSILVFIAAVSIAGCGSTIVDYRVDLEVDPPGEIVYVDVPETLTPFPDAIFTGETLRINVSVSSLLWRFVIDNRADGPVVLDWRRATIATNHHPEPVALTARHIAISGEVAAYGKGVSPGAVTRQVIGGGSRDYASFQPSFVGLTPSDHLFGLTLADERTIAEAGVGNWVLLQVPVIVAGDETLYSLRVTARDAKSRVSYH